MASRTKTQQEAQFQPSTREDGPAGNVRTYLELTRLLDGIEHQYPEVSAPLRLTLLRARRDGQIGSLDASSFRAIAADPSRSPQSST